MSEENGYTLPEQKEVKLPRNICHWARSRGLVVSYVEGGTIGLRSERKEFTSGIVDRSRHFRILGHINYFQICDGDFDRWANSVGRTLPIPMTRAEFDAALDELVATAELRELSEDRVNEDADRQIRWALDGAAALERRYGGVVAWAKTYGRHGKWVRRWVNRYESGMAKERGKIRQANRHRKAKLAELSVQKEA